MDHRTQLNHPTILLLSLAITLLGAGAAAANSVTCSFELSRVTVQSDGDLLLRVNEPGDRIFQVFPCSVSAAHQGANISAPVCSYFYTTSLAALHTATMVRLTLDTAVLDANGLWDGTCSGIVAKADLEPAMLSLAGQP